MDSKQDPYFVLELIDFVFQITGKPLPLYLQRKIDKYSKREDSNLTLSIKNAVMIYINDSLSSSEAVDVTTEQHETLMKKLLKKYTAGEFLKFISFFAYGCVSEFVKRKQVSPETYYISLVRFLENLRQKGRIGDNFWKDLDQCAIAFVEQDKGKTCYKSLRKIEMDQDMSKEKGFILKIMYLVFDFHYRKLPEQLKTEFKKYTLVSTQDPHIKNAVFVMLTEVEKKERLVDGIDPIVLHYYNLACFHFSQKYFLEFLVYGSKKALIEYINGKMNHSPKTAYELFTYILQLAKKDGKFSSLEEIIDAASKILEEDRDRIEHSRARKSSIEESSGSNQLADDSGLIGPGRKTISDCKCCTLN